MSETTEPEWKKNPVPFDLAEILGGGLGFLFLFGISFGCVFGFLHAYGRCCAINEYDLVCTVAIVSTIVLSVLAAIVAAIVYREDAAWFTFTLYHTLFGDHKNDRKSVWTYKRYGE